MGQLKLTHAGRYITIKTLTLFHAHIKIVYNTYILYYTVYTIFSVVVFFLFVHLIYCNYALRPPPYEKFLKMRKRVISSNIAF